jgi:CRISPR-associated protein Cmr2
MGYDFYAEVQVLDDLQDVYAKIQKLACDLQYKEQKKERHITIFQGPYNQYIREQLQAYRHLLTIDLEAVMMALPRGAAAWEFAIQLARPFISKDDAPYHICDNPLRKEKVFRVPMMSSTGWKGALRAAAVRLLVKDAESLSAEAFARHRLCLTRLFGNEKGWEEAADPAAYLDHIGGTQAACQYRETLTQLTENGFLAGRLRFFPTYFDKVAVEVINPHDRETKAGKLPIYFEVADIGSQGDFALLYVPFDLVGQPRAQLRAEMVRDFMVLGPALRAMFLTYGFGAKTSSGFGVVKEQLVGTGKQFLRAHLPAVASTGKPSSAGEDDEDEALSAAIKDFVYRFRLEEFPYWTNEELARSGWGSKRISKYKRLRARHPDWDSAARSWETETEVGEAGTAEDSASAKAMSECSFATLSDLCECIRDMAIRLQEGGEGK